MNYIASALGISVLLYLGWIAVAPTPIDTLDRMCAPVFKAPKKVLGSGARIFSPAAEDTINTSFDNGFARCRAWGWGVFYEDEYRAIVEAEKEAAAKAAKK